MEDLFRNLGKEGFRCFDGCGLWMLVDKCARLEIVVYISIVGLNASTFKL